MEAIALLVSHPSYEALVREVESARERYVANFARGLVSSPNAVDQREVDEKRGFWKGAMWALKTFPTMTAKDYEKFLAADPEEGETA